MGQQQLILITLAIMVVGLAIFAGVRMFDSYQKSNERDALIHQMQVLVLDARKYAAKATSFAGGGGSFSGYRAPENLSITDRFRIYVGATDSAVTFTGYGGINGEDGQTPVQVFLQYTLGDNRSEVEIIN